MGQSQTTSTIRGFVVTDDGAPIAEAAVEVRLVESGASRATLTNAAGRFVVLLLAPGGPYDVRVERLGYAPHRMEGIQLQVGEVHTLEIVLEETAIAIEGVSVNVERAEIFNPTQVGPSTLLNERVVESMPILSRDVMQLANLSPLVKTSENGAFSIGGQNDRYNQVLVDGVANKDPFGLTAGGVPGGQAGAKLLPIDAVAQYEVLVAPFDVRLSGFTGGVMNAVTKSGTNEWHLRALGVGRHETFVGDLTLPTGVVQASGVDRRLIAFSSGGPIVRDRAHFFVSTEFERRNRLPSGFNVGRDDATFTQISPDALSGFRSLLSELHGVDAGEGGTHTLRQDLGNTFTRLDWSAGAGHRVSARHVYASAETDEEPNRTAFEAYELSSNGVYRRSRSNLAAIQLFSELGTRGGNELELSVLSTTDETTAASDYAQLEVHLRSDLGNGVAFKRPVRVGSQYFAQANDLEQRTYQISNTLTLPTNGGSTYTLGFSGALYDIRHLFLPGSMGAYVYPSPADFQANAPVEYQRTRLLDEQEPRIRFQVAQWAAYVQNQIDAGKGLTMHFGLRFDAPHLVDRPPSNAEFEELFGFDTGHLPEDKIFVSPRWGFNWQSDGIRTTQVRGGAGFFTGQLPYVWLSNALHHNGLRTATEACAGRHTDDPPTGNVAPPFVPGSTLEGCLSGPPMVLRPVTVFAPDFKYPTYIKFSAIVDHELSERVSGSLGALFTHARHQVLVRDLNLGGTSGPQGPREGYGELRALFGRAIEFGFEPTHTHPEFGHVLLVTNRGIDWNYSFTGELRGYLTDDLAFQLGYSYARSFDKMSLASVDMFSNYGLTPTDQNPNNPPMVASNFDRPHKVIASIYGRPFPDRPSIEFSLLYTGESGLPFTYVYRGDLNGDGYPYFGVAQDRYNDAIYVPHDAAEVPSDFVSRALLADAIQNDPCLREHRGEIVPRNACRSPWQHRLDARFAYSFQARGSEVRFEADVINLLNLLNSSWGTIRTARTVSPVLEPTGRGQALLGVGELYSRWAGGVTTDASGSVGAAEPWSIATPESQWQAQLGVRVTLGN